MTSSEFIKGIKSAVYDASIVGTISLLQSPPGRKPELELVELSKWYNACSEADKKAIQSIVSLTAKHAVFGFLAVLDGVRQIESTEEKGIFQLQFIKDKKLYIINEPNGEYLHDLFMGELNL